MHPLSLVTRTETVEPQQLRPAPFVPDAFSTSGGLSDHFAFTESFWRATGNTPGRLENNADFGHHSVQSCLPCLACLSAADCFFLAARCDGGHAANLCFAIAPDRGPHRQAAREHPSCAQKHRYAAIATHLYIGMIG